MAKAKCVDEPAEVNSFAVDGNMHLLMLPAETYEALSREAAKRQLSLVQFLARAIDSFVSPSGGHDLRSKPVDSSELSNKVEVRSSSKKSVSSMVIRRFT